MKINRPANLRLNVPRYRKISVMPIIGPAVIKTSFAAAGKVVKVLATKASAKEHSENSMPSPPSNSIERMEFWLRLPSTVRGIHVWNRLAVMAPRTKYLPVRKKSSSAW